MNRKTKFGIYAGMYLTGLVTLSSEAIYREVNFEQKKEEYVNMEYLLNGINIDIPQRPNYNLELLVAMGFALPLSLGMANNSGFIPSQKS